VSTIPTTHPRTNTVMANGSSVAAFEREFAAYVGARYAIALCNGTATLHTALVALGVGEYQYDTVAVPPLTMSATTMAVLHAGAVPVFWDIDPRTWIMEGMGRECAYVPVSLYGIHAPPIGDGRDGVSVDDAAQTLRPHGGAAFTSYSFQASKILALGEGGMLATNDEELATRAREFSSLGYRMRPDQPRIDPATLKDPAFERHHSMGWNYRMNDVTAELGLSRLGNAAGLLRVRQKSADLYREAIAGCTWITPQFVPDGWAHDYWCYTVALEDAALWHPFAVRVEANGGERPYAAWRLTYQEPAFRHLATDGTCPVAEGLQPRLVQFQTNSLVAAERNAEAVRRAIKELGS
jgi:perosamine synthetase